jgi:hypothetical protein
MDLKARNEALVELRWRLRAVHREREECMEGCMDGVFRRQFGFV